MFKYFAPKFIKLLFIALLAVMFLVLGNLYTYKRLTHEKQIAQLTFTPINEQEYDATLRLGNFCEESIYKIYGDEWRIDTQFLKWKSWATLFGLNAMYRVDRLSGRYSKIEDENNKNHSAHDLKTISTLDLAMVAKRYKNKFPPVDTVFGSSAYKAMAPNTLYSVFVTQSGILIREKNVPSSSDIDNCVSGKSKWKNTIIKLDQKLAGFIATIN
ncbi:MAG: hypothetical protein AB8B92_09565 [Gammaproteobacteria bacterium]